MPQYIDPNDFGDEAQSAPSNFKYIDPTEGIADEPVAAPPARRPGNFELLGAGYDDLRRSAAASGAVDDLKQGQQAQETGNVPRRIGSIKGEPQFANDITSSMQQATPAQAEQYSSDKFQSAAEGVTQANEFKLEGDKVQYSPETLDFLDKKRGVSAREAFFKAPWTIIKEIGLRSGVNSVPVLGAAAAGGMVAGLPGAAAASGAVSYQLEYVNSIIDGLQKEGVDVTNVDAIKDAVANKELLARVEDRANNRALSIGAVDTLTMGVAGLGLAPFKAALPRILGNLLAQTGVQAGGGMAGEKLAQVATGEKDNRAVLAEGAGELVTGPIEAVTAANTYRKESSAPKTEEPGPLDAAKAAEESAKDPAEKLASEQERVRKEIADKGGDALDQELAAALVESNVAPEIDEALFSKRREAAALEKAEKERVQKEKDDAKRAKEGKEVGNIAGKEVGAAVAKTLAERRAATADVEQQATARAGELSTVVTEQIPNRDPTVRGKFKNRETRVMPPLGDPTEDKVAPPIPFTPGSKIAQREDATAQVEQETQRTFQEEEAYQTRERERAAQEQATRDRDFAPAAGEVELQRGETRAAVDSVNQANPPAPAPTLGDVAPELRTLAERRNQEKQNVQRPAATEAAPVQPVDRPPAKPEATASEGRPDAQSAPAKPVAAAAPVQADTRRTEVPRAAPVEPAAARNIEKRNGKPDEPAAAADVQSGPAPRSPVSGAAAVPPKSQPAQQDSRPGTAAVRSDSRPTLRGRRDKQRSVAKDDVAARSGPVEPAAVPEVESAVQRNSRANVKEDFAKRADAAYKRDLPSRGGLTSMPILWTRARFSADNRVAGLLESKEAFDTEMLARAASGEIELIPHDDVKRLSAEERENAIQDPDNPNRVFSHWRPTEQSTPAAQEQVEEAGSSERTRGRDDVAPRERNLGENNERLESVGSQQSADTSNEPTAQAEAAARNTLAARRAGARGAGTAQAASPRVGQGSSAVVPASDVPAQSDNRNSVERGARRGGQVDQGTPQSTAKPRGRDGEAGAKRKSALSRSAIAKIIGEFNREAPVIDPILVTDARDLPPQLFNDYLREGKVDAEGNILKRGLKATLENGELYLYPENITSEEDLRKTILHEYVGHVGLRALFGEKFEALLDDVYAKATDTEALEVIAKRYPNLDVRSERGRRIFAEEYMAYIAESGTDVSTLDRVIAWLRNALRKLGFVDTYTRDDIRAMLMASRSNLTTLESPRNERVERIDDEAPQEEGPLRDLYGIAATMEQQAKTNPGVVRAAWTAIKDLSQDKIEALLMTIPLRNLKDFMPAGKMDSVGAYVRELQRLDGRRNELMTETDQLAKKWLKYTNKSKDKARVLGELMHASTLSQVDPATSFKPFKDVTKMSLDERRENARRQAAYDAILPYYDRLDAEGKAMYNDVRNAYAKQRRMVFDALTSRINSSEASGQSKRQLIDELRQKFEEGNTRGPYFPLTRFGEYWAAAKNKKGETVAFSRFEKPSEQRAWVAEMEKQGFDVNADKRTGDKQTMAGVDPKFATKVAELTAGIDPQIADEIWQMYLRSMPELSMRKHFIHRKGRLGFSGDALRAFGHTMFHGAHQLAKLEHGHVLDGHLRKAQGEAAAIKKEDPDKRWATPLYKEMEKRHAWVKNPQTSAWSNKLTSLGFAWFLAASPAAGLVNLSQTAMVALPVMGAKYGYVGAVKQILRASAQLAGGRGSLGDRLRGEERAAWDEAKRIGLFGKTQAHDLAGTADGGLAYDSRWKKAAEIASWIFHKTEEINREVTFMAAFRLAKEKGQTQEQAILNAEDVTWDSHFDYSSTNRPRVMQGDVAKVLFLFRQYSVNMTYRLARDFNDSIQGATKQQKSEARKRFGGMMGMTAVFAGVTGLPMFWAVEVALNAVFDDPDDPWDASEVLREHITESMGPQVATAVTKGLVDAYTPVTLSSRVGLNNLWLREPPASLDGKDLGLHILGEALGPIPNMLLVRPFEAAKLSDEDYGERAIEKILPKALADPIKSWRYLRDGVENLKGDDLVPEKDLRARDAFMQAIGFSPSRVTMAYDQSRAIKDTETELKRRSERLTDKFYLAVRTGDSSGMSDVMEQIYAFNAKNPDIGIDARKLRQSVRARQEYSARAVNGVVVDKKLTRLYTEKNISRDLREKE